MRQARPVNRWPVGSFDERRFDVPPLRHRACWQKSRLSAFAPDACVSIRPASQRSLTRDVENMSRAMKPDQWWAIPLFLLLLPLLLVALVFWALYSLSLYLLVWTCWLTRGRDLLFVYSDSPHWKQYIEEEILPRIQHRSVKRWDSMALSWGLSLGIRSSMSDLIFRTRRSSGLRGRGRSGCGRCRPG